MLRRRVGSVLLVCWLLLAAAEASACSVPVFRYALERWKLSPYEVLVYHKGKLSPEQKAHVDALEARLGESNIDITLIDLNRNPDPPLKQFWEREGRNAPLPWVAIRQPQATPETPPLRTGSLGSANVAPALFDSPFRAACVRELARGETAVIILLPGEDEARNGEVRQLLHQEVARLSKSIRLPEQTADGPQIETHLPLKLSFQIRELSRSDPAEGFTRELLRRTEPELSREAGPIAFFLFGRGRVLCGLHGEQLQPDEIEHVLQFLCGKCSCQIKELNPGIDLLVTADWEKLLKAPAEAPAVTPEAAPVVTPEAAPEAPKVPQPDAVAAPANGSNDTPLWLALAVTLVIAVVALIWRLQART